MLLSVLRKSLAPFPPLLRYQAEPPKLHPNPQASLKRIEFEEKKVTRLLSRPALAPSCQDQGLLGLSQTFPACLWNRKQPLSQPGMPGTFFQAIRWSRAVLEASNHAAMRSSGPGTGSPRGFPAAARYLVWTEKGGWSPARPNPCYVGHSWISSSRGYYTGTPLTKVFWFM